MSFVLTIAFEVIMVNRFLEIIVATKGLQILSTIILLVADNEWVISESWQQASADRDSLTLIYLFCSGIHWVIKEEEFGYNKPIQRLSRHPTPAEKDRVIIMNTEQRFCEIKRVFTVSYNTGLNNR